MEVKGAEMLVIVGVVIAILLFNWHSWQKLAEALIEAIDNFRGGRPGSGSPPHPLPADDSALLGRRRRRAGKALL
jgi:hypothetical protein